TDAVWGFSGFTTMTSGDATAWVSASKSRSASYLRFFTRVGVIVIMLALVTRIVWPSGSAFLTASAAMAPFAPVRFSTTNGWPSFSVNCAATIRATWSIGPPAAKLTTILTGLVG